MAILSVQNIYENIHATKSTEYKKGYILTTKVTCRNILIIALKSLSSTIVYMDIHSRFRFVNFFFALLLTSLFGSYSHHSLSKGFAFRPRLDSHLDFCHISPHNEPYAVLLPLAFILRNNISDPSKK